MNEKRCFKCGKIKPLDEFYKHKQMADGHLGKCKECARNDIAKYQEENPDKALNTRISRCEKNPSKYNANKVVEAALKSGALVKPDCCFGCGRKASDTRIGAHHHDYTKPLDVVWVCAKCHRQLDANRRSNIGLQPFGQQRKVILSRDGVDLLWFDTVLDASKALGCAASSIHQCLKGVSKTCRGFNCRYAD